MFSRSSEIATTTGACVAAAVAIFAVGNAIGKYQATDRSPTVSPQAREIQSDANETLIIGAVAGMGAMGFAGLSLFLQRKNMEKYLTQIKESTSP